MGRQTPAAKGLNDQLSRWGEFDGCNGESVFRNIGVAKTWPYTDAAAGSAIGLTSSLPNTASSVEAGSR